VKRSAQTPASVSTLPVAIKNRNQKKQINSVTVAPTMRPWMNLDGSTNTVKIVSATATRTKIAITAHASRMKANRLARRRRRA
jgi:hypothetical protein